MSHGKIPGSWDDPEKSEGRFRASPRKPSYSVLALPGPDCLCVRQNIEMGLFTAKTEVFAAEHNPALRPRLAKTLESLTSSGKLKRAWVIEGGLRDFSPPLGRTFDYAFLDFMGAPDPLTLLWLRNRLVSRLERGATVSVAYNCSGRGSSFLRKALEFVAAAPAQARYCAWAARGMYTPLGGLYMAFMGWVFGDFSYEAFEPYFYVNRRTPMMLMTFADIKMGGPRFPLDFEPLLRSREVQASSVRPAVVLPEGPVLPVSLPVVSPVRGSGSESSRRILDLLVEAGTSEFSKDHALAPMLAELRAAVGVGKKPEMVVAGWRAAITRRLPERLHPACRELVAQAWREFRPLL